MIQEFNHDLEIELKPLIDYLELIYIDDELKSIGLRKDIKFKDLKVFGIIPNDTKRKDFVKLLDWFNDNLKDCYFIIKDLANLEVKK